MNFSIYLKYCTLYCSCLFSNTFFCGLGKMCWGKCCWEKCCWGKRAGKSAGKKLLGKKCWGNVAGEKHLVKLVGKAIC